MNPLAQRIMASFNFWEAWLWLAIAAGVLLSGLIRSKPDRDIALVCAATLGVFGLSDFVEMHTGAWWRPWWLLLWKGTCVVALAAVYVWYRRRKGRAERT